MAKTECIGVEDTQTNLWVTGYDPMNNSVIFGNERNAICFNETTLATVLSMLNTNGSQRFIGGRPSGRP